MMPWARSYKGLPFALWLSISRSLQQRFVPRASNIGHPICVVSALTSGSRHSRSRQGNPICIPGRFAWSLPRCAPVLRRTPPRGSHPSYAPWLRHRAKRSYRSPAIRFTRRRGDAETRPERRFIASRSRPFTMGGNPCFSVDDRCGDLDQGHCRRHGSTSSAPPRAWKPASVRRGRQMRSPYLGLPLPLAKRHARRYTPAVSTEAFSGGI
jgi:hypothetical protein